MKALLFPGQGTQQTGMGKDLFSRYKELTDIADGVLQYSIVKLCLENPENRLSQTLYSQPAIFVVNHLSFLAYRESHPEEPDYLLGHSLGEYNALLAAGAFDFETGMKIVQKRAELTSQVQNGAMVALIGLTLDQVSNTLEKFGGNGAVGIANINSGSQIVLAGLKQDLARLEESFVKAGAKWVPLHVNAPFHSKYLEEPSRKLKDFLGKFSFSSLNIQVISNTNACPYREDRLVDTLAEHLTMPVKWHDSIVYLVGQGTGEFIEINNERRILTRLTESIRAELSGQEILTTKPAVPMLLPDIISDRANTEPEKLAVRFIKFSDTNEITEELLSNQALAMGAARIAKFLRDMGAKNERVLLFFSPGLDYIISFFGCLTAKAIAVPSYPPLNRKLYPVLEDIVLDSGSKYVLTSREIYEKVFDDLRRYPALQALTWIVMEDIPALDWQGYRPEEVRIQPDDIAYLQYTSGSTSKPKGVMITHQNMLANSEYINEKFEHTKDSRILMWTPPFHDMGLVGGIIHPVHKGIDITLMNPVQFFQQPIRWLQAITRYKITTSAGPNFAYDLCIQKIKPEQKELLDLSSWSAACNGAEQVSARTLDEFAQYFASCGFNPKAAFPCYGLAENVLFASAGPKREEPRRLIVAKDELNRNQVLVAQSLNQETQVLVSNGSAPDGEEIQVVHPETKEICSENQIGEIWLKGPSVAKGYWDKDDVNREQFQAATRCGKAPYMRTGDLAFWNQGELFITGRMKDMIIIRGRNYYPHDIEKAVNESHEFCSSLRSAAFSVSGDNGEKLVIIIETRRKPGEQSDLIFESIIGKISDEFNIGVHFIGFVAIGSLPVTTSGKLQRGKSRQYFVNQEFDYLCSYAADDRQHYHEGPDQTHEFDEIIAQMPAAEKQIFDFLMQRFSTKLNIEPGNLSPGAEFGRYGLESIHAIELAGEIESWLGRSFSPTVIYNNPTILQLTKVIMAENLSEQNLLKELSGSPSCTGEDIAIIGMGGIFPGAEDPDGLWQNLIQGKNLISQIPESRWDWKKYRFGAGEPAQPDACSWGGFADAFRYFDHDFFNISREEAEAMDPQQRKLLEVVWNTFEDAGYSPMEFSGKPVGVYIGVSATDFNELLQKRRSGFSSYSATGTSLSLVPNRISYFFDFHGPSESVDTACSSSLIAFHKAAQAIRNGECQVAIAGGANILLSPDKYKALQRTGVLSPNGQCKTFDKDANGYVRAEGVGAVLLKPLAAAIRDKDPVYAVIKGSAENHGGRANSLTAPNQTIQTALLLKTYQNSGVDPRTISYIETHGTGTALGDPIEVEALQKAFAVLAQEQGTDTGENVAYCGLGSVKTNLGHLEAGAGIAGLIKIILSLRYKMIPPTINFDHLNPYIKLEESPFYIVNELREWQSGKFPRRAGISSFGFGGSYAHAILEEYQNGEVPDNGTLTPQLFMFSAKDKPDLIEYLKRFTAFLRDETSPSGCSLEDMAYTLRVGRKFFNYRLAVIADSREVLIGLLEDYMDGRKSSQRVYETAGILTTNKPTVQSLDGEGLSLEEMAKDWVSRKNVDLTIPGLKKCGKRCHLPGYQFKKNPFDISYQAENESSSDYQVNLLPENIKTFTYETISAFLATLVSNAARISLEEVDENRSFYDYGLTSIDIINIHSKLSNLLNTNLPQDSFYKYPTIQALTKAVLDTSQDTRVDLWQDVVLDETIQPPANMPVNPSKTDKILLTGATGYVGSYLLHELIQQTQAVIYCLVRGKSKEAAMARIRDNFINYELATTDLSKRVEVVLGDLGETYFGMAEADFDHLAGEIDVIYHSGGMVDWVKPYVNLKKENVGGTHEIIRLAFRHHLKPLHFISSLAIIPLSRTDYYWKEEPIPDYHGIFTGYGQSKWVAEQLCLEAKRRGLPVSIYRFDFAIGTLETGIMKESDFIIRMIKGAVQLKCIPDIEVYFDFVPVDYLVKIILVIGFDPANLGKVFHIFNEHPFPSSGFIDLLNAYHYKIHKIPYDIWKDLVLLKKDNALHPTYPFLMHFDYEGIAMYRRWIVYNYRAAGYLEKNAPELLFGMPKPRPLLGRIMKYLIDQNIIPIHDENKTYDQDLCYWHTTGVAEPAAPAVPMDIPKRPATAKASVRLEGEIADKLLSMTEKYQISTMELLLGLIYIINSRYHLGADTLIGIPVMVNGQTDQIQFINFEMSLNDDPIFPLVLHRTQNLLEQIYRESVINNRLNAFTVNSNGIDHHVLFGFNDQTSATPQYQGFYTLPPNQLESIAERSDLTYSFYQNGAGIGLDILYNTAVIQEATIELMLKHLQLVVNDLTEESGHDIFRYQLWVGCDILDQEAYE